MKRLRMKACLVFTLILGIFSLSGCGNAGNGHWDETGGATLTAITVTPANATIATSLTRQFTATGIFSDGTSQDITSEATWSSGTTNVATVNAGGLATGVAAGTSVITATSGSLSGNTSLTVTAATLNSIAVTPLNQTVVNGLTKQFTATGIDTDGVSHDITALVIWSSGTTAVATINASGLATGVAGGTSAITATLTGKSGSTDLTVATATLNAIAVTPALSSVANGLTTQFIATGTFSNGSIADITTAVTWSSGTLSVATLNPNGVANSGLATSVATGTSVITATSGIVSGSTTLTVTAATLSSIAVTPLNPTVVNGLTRQFTATGTFSNGSIADVTPSVVWSSGNTGVATMNPNGAANSGLATSVAAGSSVITATSGLVSGNTTLTVTAATLSSIVVTPLNPSVVNGQTRQFTATGTYSDASTANITTSVIWSSGNTGVATMNLNGTLTSGRATGAAIGTSVITATSGLVSGNTRLTVIAALANNPTAPDLGETARFVSIASQRITTTTGSALADGDLAILDQARSFYAGFTADAIAGQFVELSNGLSYAPDDVTPPYVVPVPYASMVAFINQVRTDLGSAAAFLEADPNLGAPTQVCPIELGNLTLPRGVYRTASNVTIQTGNLTLDGQGDPDSVWIFQIIGTGTLTTGAPGGSIDLIGGAQARNVYWRTAGTTVIGTNTIFQGNVFAWPQVNVNTGADVIGRLFSVTEQVTLDANAVTMAP